jgi:hypothetical protein
MDDLYGDPQRARDMGLHARKRYEALFTGSAMGRRYAEVYQQVLDENRAA